jgi:YaiO family outer membrane protein
VKRNRLIAFATAVLLCCLLAFTCVSSAQQSSPAPTARIVEGDKPETHSGSIEFGAGYSYDGDRNWDGPYIRGMIEQSPGTEWTAEVARVRAFADTGFLFIGGLTHDFGEKWFADFNAASSHQGFFLPRFSAEAEFHRKWLREGRLVASFGAGYDRYKDQTNVYQFPFSVSYALTRQWKVEGGMGFAYSAPDPVLSRAQFFAVTQGREKKHLVTVRAEFGSESYQIIAPDLSISNFHSRGISLRWRQWIHGSWGYKVSAGYYSNPYYLRKGAELGFFRDF